MRTRVRLPASPLFSTPPSPPDAIRWGFLFCLPPSHEPILGSCAQSVRAPVESHRPRAGASETVVHAGVIGQEERAPPVERPHDRSLMTHGLEHSAGTGRRRQSVPIHQEPVPCRSDGPPLARSRGSSSPRPFLRRRMPPYPTDNAAHVHATMPPRYDRATMARPAICHFFRFVIRLWLR